ncbi:MAG TPA: Gfo/Idh/MocA family oxidoreductase [Bryobacteraceae bacterium]|jgi:predicted dehydrogenase|nr:Gfo/Idh/MocA family oxidoreductase [Bryobacteraceae bacterium]
MNFTRRDFARTLGAAAALPSLPARARTPNQSPPTRKFGYCIVGLGRISLGHFMPACRASQNSQVTALVSGHRDKAEKTAAEYNVSLKNIYSYQNYDEIASNPDIDAVYIALPNNMHAEYTIRAANASKHVLCEKPMATSVKDCQNMIAACKAANKKLMIAYRCQYEPANLRAIQLIRDGKLGAIQAIESANGFIEHPGEWRLDKRMAGGGPLMDVGVYSLNACRYLTGEEPASLEAYCSVVDKDTRFREVEENCSWTMKFPSGIVAACNTTYGANMPGFFRVHGLKGMIHMEPAFAYQGLHLTAKLEGEPPIDDQNSESDPYQFVLEADYFADCAMQNKEPKTDGDEGLRDMQYMAQIYKSAGRTLG